MKIFIFKNFRKKINDVNCYLKNKGINRVLQNKIRCYVEYIHNEEQNGYYRGERLLRNINRDLKEELYEDSFGKFLKRIPIFEENFSPEFIAKLSLSVSETTVFPNEIVVIKIFFYMNENLK